jgi:hypothetical protein
MAVRVHVDWKVPVLGVAGFIGGALSASRGEITSWDDNQTRRCEADLSPRRDMLLGASIGDLSGHIHYDEGNWDCAFQDGNYLRIQVWTLLFVNINRITYNLRAGTTRRNLGINFGLGLGYFRFNLTVADARHN